jgi:hypothetical protein
MTMKLKELLAMNLSPAPQPEAELSMTVNMALDLEALDDCVGGRAETEGVGCYVHSDQPSSN